KSISSNSGHSFGTTDYTYDTAPTEVRKLYEKKCKKIGKKPKNSDKIELSNANSTNVMQ
ncbi:TPA: hypothetical protein KOP60_003245, partial [Clostridioides difficile]|nr:hypothetical protein [Clostridioides difficile]HBF5038270.1 hypothetical protein [Clostridioides difficile]HBF5411128.1 hypothetical protein [Clostridioides difficile]